MWFGSNSDFIFFLQAIFISSIKRLFEPSPSFFITVNFHFSFCQVYSKTNFWIGYNDIDSEGDWIWSDRATSSYTNWDDKSPNNGGVSCAIVTSNGKWHDEPCQSQFGFICKKPSKYTGANLLTNECLFYHQS